MQIYPARYSVDSSEISNVNLSKSADTTSQSADTIGHGYVLSPLHNFRNPYLSKTVFVETAMSPLYAKVYTSTVITI